MAHNKDRALEPIEFIQMLNAVDDFYGQPFLLLDWQYEVLWNVYGTVKPDGLRQYKYAYLEIPKKNGKTSLIAAIALYHLCCDGPGGQIYCCAADRGQAELVYKAACGMREQNGDLEQLLKLTDSKKEIKNTITGTTMKVLSAEAYTKHGLNPTVVIFDELHAQPNRELWDIMTFGAGSARREPIWWVITTAGDDPDRHSIGWEIHEQAQRIKDGEISNPAWYVKIYNAPEDADIFDEATWYQANPSLGKTINIDTVRQEALDARNRESAERLFRWLRLNQWISVKSIGWLPLTLWDSTVGSWDPGQLVGKKCYLGLDLASTTDLTACALLFPPQEGLEEWAVMFEGWIPDEKMKERIKRDNVPYDQWVKAKYLHVTPGNAVDYEFVEARIKTLAQQYDVKYLCTDPWNSRMLTQRLEKADIDAIEVSQTIAGLSPGMKEIERLLMSKQMTHEKNPVARWCFGNMVVAIDGNENLKPMKNKSKDRIDLIVAMINAMAIAIKLENQTSVYEERGMRSLL
jgi:phage terminase large subunit-like protein